MFWLFTHKHIFKSCWINRIIIENIQMITKKVLFKVETETVQSMTVLLPYLHIFIFGYYTHISKEKKTVKKVDKHHQQVLGSYLLWIKVSESQHIQFYQLELWV